MSKVVRADVDNLNAVLTVTVEKNDFVPKYKAELQKYRKQSNMKGFRKGQTPISMVRKMYGKQVLSNVVGEAFSDTLDEYIKENDLNILGRPMPSKDQELLDFDLKSVTDYTLDFDLGLEPQFELKGASANDSYMHYVVEIPEEDVDQELDRARKQLGDRINPTDGIEENDIVALAALELDDKGEVKDEGVEAEFSLLVSSIADEEVKKDILSKKVGDVVRFNVYKLEKEREGEDGEVDAEATKKYVNKHLLKLEDEFEGEVSDTFEARIEEVNRIAHAEMNQAFFDKYFGEGAVSSELEARTEVKKNIAKAYNNLADALLFRDIQKRVLEETEIELP
ncbi:MAG: trigger factor, partial [Saprospiraceae bacterium]